MQQTQVNQEQNFTVKFNNGTWKVFSRWHFGDSAVFALEKEAVEACANFNKRWDSKQ
jgi:hypothetical protein